MKRYNPDQFFRWLSEPMKPEDIYTWNMANNIIPELTELFKDFCFSFYYLVRDTYLGDNYKNLNEFKKTLNFPVTGTPLDDKYDILPVQTPNWLLTRKQIVLMANAQSTGIGRQTFDNFVGFYEEFSTEYGNYFNDGSIYHKWIGSHSELHQLTDE